MTITNINKMYKLLEMNVSKLASFRENETLWRKREDITLLENRSDCYM